jgi:hypothetical protein
MVSTRADSASRHMLQCRVHKDRLLSWTESQYDNNELLVHKHKYCLAKDELALEVATPMKRGSDQYARVSNPYPLVLSSFHGLGEMPNCVYACLMAHGASFNQGREDIFDRIGETDNFLDGFNTEEKKKMKREYEQTKTLPYFRTMGYSVGTAYAHEGSGDTMASVMIGGINTCLNGAFPMQTGDRVMWYLTAAESKMFRTNGERIVLTSDAGRAPDYNPLRGEPSLSGTVSFRDLTWTKIKDYVGKVEKESDIDRNKISGLNKGKAKFIQQKNGFELAGGSQKNSIALIKPFFYKNASDGDFERVFAVCLSPAAPFEMVDIMISRQSL